MFRPTSGAALIALLLLSCGCSQDREIWRAMVNVSENWPVQGYYAGRIVDVSKKGKFHELKIVLFQQGRSLPGIYFGPKSTKVMQEIAWLNSDDAKDDVSVVRICRVLTPTDVRVVTLTIPRTKRRSLEGLQGSFLYIGYAHGQTGGMTWWGMWWDSWFTVGSRRWLKPIVLSPMEKEVLWAAVLSEFPTVSSQLPSALSSPAAAELPETPLSKVRSYLREMRSTQEPESDAKTGVPATRP